MTATGFNELHDLEGTMTRIIGYLLVAHEKHPRYIVRDRERQQKITSARVLKAAQQLAIALVDSGYDPMHDAVRWVGRWFASPFPTVQSPRINEAEMIRLEGLLHLDPHSPAVQPRLRQLVHQRVRGGFFNIPHEQRDSMPIDTLWALRVIMLAREKGVLRGYMSDDEIAEMLLMMGRSVHRDQDRTLVHRLYFALRNCLEDEQVTVLDAMLILSEQNLNVFGVRNNIDKYYDLLRALLQKQLTAGVVSDREEDLRHIVQSILFAVENLSPLAVQYPQIRQPIEEAMDLWWSQFAGDDAPFTLGKLFPSEYSFLMVMCRTLLAVNAYNGQTVKDRFFEKSIYDISEQFRFDQSPEMRSIEEALRRWVHIKIENPTTFELGLSGSNVVRIQPHLIIPTESWRVPEFTLVVKYGNVEEIAAERRAYESLPGRIQRHFVRIPEQSYVNSTRQAFVIMEDLRDYETLFEIYPKVLGDDQFALALCEFLFDIHNGDGTPPRLATNKTMREVYLVPMLLNLSQIRSDAGYVRSKGTIETLSDNKLDQVDDIINRLLTGMKRINNFPMATMHGDLHTRNIMLYAPNGKITNDFRLIDLEKLHMEGDMAHDAGHLLMDLNTLAEHELPESFGKNSIRDGLIDLQETIELLYADFARQRLDDTFPLRLKLAKARALIRINKGRFRRGIQYLESRDFNRAENTLLVSAELMGQTIKKLEEVCKAIE